MAGAEARFPIVVEDKASGPSAEAAAAMDRLRTSIQAAEGRIRQHADSLKRLKGSSDEVKAAKDELKAKIAQEQAAITSASLEIRKAGSSYGALADAAKKAAVAEAAAAKASGGSVDATKSMGGALKAIGGPLGPLPERFENLKKALSGADGGMGLFTLAAGAAVVVVAALAAALVAGSVAFGSWLITNANATRTTWLTQQALLGTEQAANDLGREITDLTGKVPVARGELEEMANQFALAGARGDKLVDSLNAVAQVTGAVGKEAGGKFQSALMKSLKGEALTAKDLEGTGLDLSKVDLSGGAKELRRAVETQFGQINAKKVLDLTVQAERFKDTLARLTTDVNLEPLLKAMNEVLSVFDDSTVSGEAMKELVTLIGNGLSSAAEESAPIIKALLKGMVIGALQGAILFYQLRNAIRDTFGGATLGDIDLLNVALETGRIIMLSIAASIAAAYVGFQILAANVRLVVDAFNFLVELAGRVKKTLTEGWGDTGKSIVTGLAGGITGGAGAIVSSVAGLADKVKGGFKSALGIKSPSTVFAEYGQMTAAGFQGGVEDGTTGATSAVQALAPAPAAAGAAASGGAPAGGGVVVRIEIHVGGGADGEKVAKQLDQAGVFARIQECIDDALVMSGRRAQTA